LTVGERIRSARQRLGMSQVTLAKKVGVSRAAIYNWEIDRTDIRKDKIPRLGSVLGLELSALSTLSPFGRVSAPVDEDGNTTLVAYLRRIDNTVSRMAEDIDQVKVRLAYLESRVTSLETAVHKRLDSMQKQIDNIGPRLDRTDRSGKQ
jgi:transcriptional regulator with XRE-family HTH domain